VGEACGDGIIWEVGGWNLLVLCGAIGGKEGITYSLNVS